MLICSGRVQLAVSDFREKLAWRGATAWQPSLPPAHQFVAENYMTGHDKT